MDKEKILEGMNFVDPALVEAADAAPCRRRSVWRQPALIAACLCLVLAGTSMAVAARLNWSFGNGFRLDEENLDVFGTLEVWSPEILPVESLSQEARDLAEAAGPEVEAFKGFMSDEMGTVRTEIDGETGFRVISDAPVGMDAWDQMERFLGVDILPENPVLRSAINGILYVGEEACRCALYLYNGADGELYSVNTYGTFNTSYDPAADRSTVSISIATNARTDRNPYDKGGGSATLFMTEEEQARSTQEEHVTPSGLECLLTSTDQGWEAYFCYGASVVHLSATSFGDGVDDETVRAELIRVLDAFE